MSVADPLAVKWDYRWDFLKVEEHETGWPNTSCLCLGKTNFQLWDSKWK